MKPEEHPITAFPDTLVQNLSPDDQFLIIGCDGIWETKTNQEMVDFVIERLNKKVDLQEIVKELLYDIISPDYTKTSKFSEFNIV